MNLLADWLPDVLEDPVVLSRDIGVEAGENLWTFSLSAEQAATVGEDELVAFVRQAEAARARWITAHAAPPMVFYCWCDEQAAQLRFSLVSASHGALPFGCTVRLVPDVVEIVRAFLNSPYHGGIPWSVLTAETSGPEGLDASLSTSPYVLAVWSSQVP